MDKRLVIILGVLFLSLVVFIVLPVFFSSPTYGFGMMNNHMTGGYQNYSVMNNEEAKLEVKESLQGAEINKKDNTIRFSENELSLIMLAGHGETDNDLEENATDQGEKFIIGGLANPTIYLPKGARVTMQLINQDEEMPHGIVLTQASPPYSYMSMMNWGYGGISVPVIPEAKENKLPYVETNFQINKAAELYYICQVPGHAADGMYGKIIFE